MTTPEVSIVPVSTIEDVEISRSLFREYAASLSFDLDFQQFDDELESLPGVYAPPGGCILLACIDGNSAGCVALRRIESDICEMKRLYVRPDYRGMKIGRQLAIAVIKKGQRIGYKKMRLDTVNTMIAANTLYRSLGFTEIKPYRHNPLPGATFMELVL